MQPPLGLKNGTLPSSVAAIFLPVSRLPAATTAVPTFTVIILFLFFTVLPHVLLHFEKLIGRQSLAKEQAISSLCGAGSQERKNRVSGSRCGVPCPKSLQEPLMGKSVGRVLSKSWKHKARPSWGIWHGLSRGPCTGCRGRMQFFVWVRTSRLGVILI